MVNASFESYLANEARRSRCERLLSERASISLIARSRPPPLPESDGRGEEPFGSRLQRFCESGRLHGRCRKLHRVGSLDELIVRELREVAHHREHVRAVPIEALGFAPLDLRRDRSANLLGQVDVEL
jgi:hypothetical protein